MSAKPFSFNVELLVLVFVITLGIAVPGVIFYFIISAGVTPDVLKLSYSFSIL